MACPACCSEAHPVIATNEHAQLVEICGSCNATIGRIKPGVVERPQAETQRPTEAKPEPKPRAARKPAPKPGRAVREAKAELKQVRRELKALRKELVAYEKAERELARLVDAADGKSLAVVRNLDQRTTG